MAKTTNTNKTNKPYSTSALFTRMNQLRKSKGLTQKEAFAEASRQLTAEHMVSQLIKFMSKGAVRFTFINKRGNEATTTGTLIMDRVPKTRKVDGRRTAENPNMLAFYDIRHGIFRTFEKDKLISIDKAELKRGRPVQKKEDAAVLEPA